MPAGKPPRLQKNELLVEVAGPGVDLVTVTSKELLELAAAYVDLVGKIAEEDGVDLAFSGLEVRAKCAAVVVHVNRPEAALESVRQVPVLMSKPDDAAAGLRRPVLRLIRATQSLPPTYQAAAMVLVRAQERRYRIQVEAAQAKEPLASMLQMRATPVRVGGATPKARFEGRGEPKAFTLSADSWDEVRRIGASILKPVDIVAQIVRDEEGLIESGRLIEFQEVTELASLAVWQEWYRANADRILRAADAEEGGLDS